MRNSAHKSIMTMRAYLLVTSVLVTTSVGELELVNQLFKLTSHIVRGKRSIAANYDDSHCLANFEQREKNRAMKAK